MRRRRHNKKPERSMLECICAFGFFLTRYPIIGTLYLFEIGREQ